MSILQNRYGTIYNLLIQNAQSKNRNKKDGYFESHHILPRSMGGTNQKTNLVLLTAREHYIAHLLLVRCVSDDNVYKMIAALARFRKQAQSGRSYELFRTTLSKYSKGSLNKSFGKIWIHNKETLDIRYVLKTEFESMNDSWVKGLPYQRGGYTNEYIWLHKGNQRTAVHASKQEEFLSQGWTLGRNVKFESEHYKKMAAVRNTPEKNAEHSKSLTGRISIRNIQTGEIKRVLSDQVNDYLANGFVLHKGSGLKMVTSSGKSCSIHGQIFKSVSEAAKTLNVKYGAIIRKIQNPKVVDCFYTE